ncbi:pathogenesis-related protein 2-like [Senna tora]|uniref:Pathogenesis-related protein 2-like n=1 Tax=Senna tora TaxID=362788 RepID=A0A834T1F4_9FABA|nr:pathogenesis-related protein 2-like [Senna tora]
MSLNVISVEKEYTLAVPRAKLFNFVTKDLHQHPNAANAIHSVQHAGAHKKINLNVSGGETHSALGKLEEIDEANFGYKYSVVEAKDFPDKVEKTTHDVKLLEGPNGGTIAKDTVSYFYKGDVPPTDFKAAKDKVHGIFKHLEAHLLAN